MFDALQAVAPDSRCGFHSCTPYRYGRQRDLYYQEWQRLYNLNGPALPQQCGELWRTLIGLSREANAYVEAGKAPASERDGSTMLTEIGNAKGVLLRMLRIIQDSPGTCR